MLLLLINQKLQACIDEQTHTLALGAQHQSEMPPSSIRNMTPETKIISRYSWCGLPAVSPIYLVHALPDDPQHQ